MSTHEAKPSAGAVRCRGFQVARAVEYARLRSGFTNTSFRVNPAQYRYPGSADKRARHGWRAQLPCRRGKQRKSERTSGLATPPAEEI